MNDSGKDFFKVTEMSGSFRVWCQTRKDEDMKAVELRLWELKFQLTIAQQLTIIAGHLGTIVGKSKELKNGAD